MKKHWKRRLLASFLALTMVLGFVPSAFAQDEGESEINGLTWTKVENSEVTAAPRGEAYVEPEQPSLYSVDEQVRVSIILEDAPTLAIYSAEDGLSPDAVEYRERLQAYQDAVAEYISDEVLDGDELDVVWNVTLVDNAISANVEYGQIEAIKALDGVADVVVETRYEIQGFQVDGDEPQMLISTGMTGANVAWSEGYTGAGMRIAIIDTGLDIEHQSFESGAFDKALLEDAEDDGLTVKDYGLLDAEKIDSVLTGLNAYKRVPTLTAEALYISSKIPFGFNYVDKNTNVTHMKDIQGGHGSHVAGIAAANRYVKVDGEYVKAADAVKMVGNAPDAQVLVMKVFGSGGGAYDGDYMAAIEDAIVLGCDTVNLSLGSSAPGMTTSEYDGILDKLANSNLIATISAGNNGYWSQYATTEGSLYSDDVQYHTGGSPGTYTNSLGVASVDNDGMISDRAIVANGVSAAYIENLPPASEAKNSTISDLADRDLEYVFLDSFGWAEDYAGIDVNGKVVFCSRGELDFAVKANNAVENGAIATIIYNNAPGTMGLRLTGYTHTEPAVAITQRKGMEIKKASEEHTTDAGMKYYTGTMRVSTEITDAPETADYKTMSVFSSFGAPGDLSMKPEISAPGGNIWSLYGQTYIEGGHDQYVLMSGTSMAAPQMAGIGALVKQYIKTQHLSQSALKDRALAQSLMMSTAEPMRDADGHYYSVLQQGSGLVNAAAATSADSYILMGADANDSWKDGKVKVELGDDPGQNGVYNFTFSINNLDGAEHRYTLDADVFTQHYSTDEDGNGILSISTDDLTSASFFYTAEVSNGTAGMKYDFDGNGIVTLDDGTALLDYVTGNRASIYHEEDASFAALGEPRDVIDSYSGHQFLQVMAADDVVTVPAGGSVTIHATIALNQAEMTQWLKKCPKGLYVEAYVFVESVADPGGATGTSHSIPVLGFYGDWTEPSMFDKGGYWEYATGAETRTPYLPTTPQVNAVLIKHAVQDNPNTLYYLGDPNPAHDNLFSSVNGDTLVYYSAALIRNASAIRAQIRNADTGVVYKEFADGPLYSAFFYPNEGAWANVGYNIPLNWRGTDASGNPLPTDTNVEIILSAAPELCGDSPEEIDWDSLGSGASLTTTLTIDSTAPDVDVAPEHIDYNPATQKMTFQVWDNQYVDVVALYNSTGTRLMTYEAVDQAQKNTWTPVTLDVSNVIGKGFYVQVIDYASNATTYKVEMSIRPNIEEYYTIFTGRNNDYKGDFKWVTYSKDGAGKVELSPRISYDMAPKSGAYACGYVFTLPLSCQLWAYDVEDFNECQWIAKLDQWTAPAKIAECLAMAYNKTDGMLYALSYSIGNTTGVYDQRSLGRIDPATGDFTNLGVVFPSADGMAITDDGRIYVMDRSAVDGKYNIYSMQTPVTASTRLNFTQVVETDVTDIFSSINHMTTAMTWDSNTSQLVLATNSPAANGSGDKAGIYTIDLDTGKLHEEVKLANDVYPTVIYTPPTDDTPLPNASVPTGMTLSDSSVAVAKGDHIQLSATLEPWYLDNKAVTWTSSDPSIAAVDENGKVKGVNYGTATITATSVATPSVTATCEVEVFSIDWDLTGVVWDESGVWWSAINTTDPANFEKLQKTNLPIVAATMGADNVIYAATLNDSNASTASTFYTIDPETMGETYLHEMGGGWPVASVLYLPTPSQKLWVLSSNRILLADEGDENGVLGLPLLPDGQWFLAGAYIGEGRYSQFPNMPIFPTVPASIFMAVDNTGTLYQFMATAERGITVYKKVVGTVIPSPNADLVYNAMVYAKGGDNYPYLFWSRWNDEDVSQLYAIDIAETNNRGVSYLGDFGPGVWPVTGLMTDDLPGLPESVAESLQNGEMTMIEGAFTEMCYNAEPEQPSEAPEFPEVPEFPEAPGFPEAPEVPEVPETPGAENEDAADPAEDMEYLTASVVSFSASGVVDAAKRTATVQITLDQASTNGKLEITYDASQLTLVDTNGKAILNSFNTSTPGKVVFAYAYKDAAAGGTVVAELTFSTPAECDTVVTVKTLEDGLTAPGTTVDLPIQISAATTPPTTPVYPPIPPAGGSSTTPSKPEEPAEPTEPTEPTKPTEPEKPAANRFVDVEAGTWYEEYVNFMVNRGLMTGTSPNTFSPDAPLSRAMLVTLLYRAAGEPAVSGSNNFSDVVAGSWYDASVTWASLNGIVEGYGDGTFLPDKEITRQEMAVILWRYARTQGINVSSAGSTIPDFADRDEIAPWAGEAVSWAYSRGIIGGDGNKLNPGAGATRAEAAAMLTRFLRLIENSQDPMY